MAYVLSTLGGAIAAAGVDKLAGDRGYDKMFRRLGWSHEAMQLAALAETLGGLLMMPRSSRRAGGALVAAVSAAVLFSEVRHSDGKLAVPRGLVLLTGLAALMLPRR